MKVDYHGASDIGLSRLNNEDVFGYLPEENFFALADGMGGHNAGEVAAQLTIEYLCRFVSEQNSESHTPKEWEALLSDAIFDANLHVYKMGEKNSAHKGMGTTLCLALIQDKKLVIGYVGDSRIYRFRKGRLTLLTQDHSLKGELIASGKLDEEAAKTYPKKNVLTRAIGTQMTVDPDLFILDIESEDLYLLCSDGLTDPLSDTAIADEIEKHRTLQEIIDHLILEAKKASGGDNITLLCFKVTY